MENYSIYLHHESDKYTFIDICRNNGAKITDVSGCGEGYHICLLATPAQATRINRDWGRV
jgi:hypothetical protein